MKNVRFIILVAGVLSSACVLAQSQKDGLYEYDRENYQRAATIFQKLVTSEPTKGENYYYLGQSLLGQHKNDSAAIVFTAGTKSEPKDPYDYIGLAKCALNANKTTDAVAFIEKAKSEASKKDIKVMCAIAEAYTHTTNPNYTEAENILTAATAINYKDPLIMFTKGELYFAKNDGGKAVSSYQDAIEAKYEVARSNTYIGVIWKQALNYASSTAAFQAAIAADMAYAPAYREEAELYSRFAKYNEAKEAYQKYMTLADLNDDIRYRYAQILYFAKDYAGSLSILKDLNTRRANDPYMYRLLAYNSFETGDSLLAKKNIELTLQNMDPKKIIALDYDYAAKVQQKFGNDSLMSMYYDKEIALDSTKRGDIYTAEAKLYYGKKQYAKAATAYANKVKYGPNPPAVTDVFYEGLSYYFIKQYINADSAFIQAARLSPKWVQPLTWMGRSLNAYNQFVDTANGFNGVAIDAYKRVIDVSGGDSIKYKKDLAEAYNYMAYYYCYVKHDGKQAEDVLKRVLNIDPENKQAIEMKKNLVCVEPPKTPTTTGGKTGVPANNKTPATDTTKKAH